MMKDACITVIYEFLQTQTLLKSMLYTLEKIYVLMNVTLGRK